VFDLSLNPSWRKKKLLKHHSRGVLVADVLAKAEQRSFFQQNRTAQVSNKSKPFLKRERIRRNNLGEPGADPASNVRGGDFSNMW